MHYNFIKNLLLYSQAKIRQTDHAYFDNEGDSTTSLEKARGGCCLSQGTGLCVVVVVVGKVGGVDISEFLWRKEVLSIYK